MSSTVEVSMEYWMWISCYCFERNKIVQHAFQVSTVKTWSSVTSSLGHKKFTITTERIFDITKHKTLSDVFVSSGLSYFFNSVGLLKNVCNKYFYNLLILLGRFLKLVFEFIDVSPLLRAVNSTRIVFRFVWAPKLWVN